MSSSKPRYLQICEQIRLLIRNQDYRAGDLLPTEAELCVQHEASRPTIAKALKLLSDEKLVRRRAGFGTQVLAPRRSVLTAGLLVPGMYQTEIFEPICASILEAAGIEGMRIVRPSGFDLEQDVRKLTESLVQQYIEAKVRGVFFTPVEHIPDQVEFNLRVIERLLGEGIYVVLLDRDVHPWPKQTQCDLVGIDNIEAGFVVTDHLVKNGCKRIAFVSAADPAMTVKLREIGCREAFIANQRGARELVEVEFLSEKGHETARELMDQQVDGVVCANDATAAPLLRALLDAGAKIPSEIKVCGFDDVKYASLLSVPLTSYRQPCKDIGRVAAEVMIHRIKHPDSPAHRVTLRGELICRRSSEESV